jgi:AcrR family transcriptional regulator
MQVSRQSTDSVILKGARARTWKLMIATARDMMQNGHSPSVSDVAEQAEVSRSTAYRYFPTQAAMVHAVVGESLGPILEWNSDKSDPVERVADLIAESFPVIADNEMTFRAALRVALDSEGVSNAPDTPSRGHRVKLLERALSPLASVDNHNRLVQALSVLYGVEGLVVLRDICGLDHQASQDVIAWAAEMLTQATINNTT